MLLVIETHLKNPTLKKLHNKITYLEIRNFIKKNIKVFNSYNIYKTFSYLIFKSNITINIERILQTSYNTYKICKFNYKIVNCNFNKFNIKGIDKLKNLEIIFNIKANNIFIKKNI